ncbi:hypothetical protein [Paludibacterium denitrificans]|uniref:hypothetical protein n=1 Tax=Paludibacterium denitrificans TaxID=2675226 RepID=UPI001E4EA10A|nr:hypothetical protein [Paludibacterium denitrificans]
MTLVASPDTAGERDYQRIRAAIRYLVAHADQQPTLAELAAELALSEAHLQRLFTRWARRQPQALFAADYLRSRQSAAGGRGGGIAAGTRTGAVWR